MISVCILTKNVSATLQKTLESTRLFSEVVILDNGSTDETCQIASLFPNVKIYHSPFIGFGRLRNKAALFATHDWILALDSDEVLSPSLIEEILRLKLDPQMAYLIPRHNFYNGKRIRGCGWDHEKVARLYHRLSHSFSEAEVHESLQYKQSIELSSPLLHTPYRSTTDFLTKMEHYSTLFAKQYKGKRKSSFFKAISHALYAFFRSYFLKRGLFCGSEGFIISLYNANTTFYKYLKLKEAMKQSRDRSRL
jgi:glycosyltransferase involved in cell wall biosynthesis